MNWIKDNYTKNFFAFLFITAFILILFQPVLIGEKTFFTFFDNSEQFYPWYQKLNSSLHKGYLPLWDANVFGGKCFAGEFQTGIFYPLNILWIFLFGTQEIIALKYLELLVILHYIIAAMGMYWVCKHFKISTLASIIGGLIFALAGCLATKSHAQSAIFFGLTLTPLVYLFTLKYLSSKKNYYIVLAGIVLGLQILAGHIQPFFHAAILSTTFIAYTVLFNGDSILFLEKAKRLLKTYTLLISAAVVTALPQLYLGLRYMKQAYRWVNAENPIGPGDKIPFETFSEKFIVNPLDFLNLIDRHHFSIDDANDLFIGLIPLIIVMVLIYKSYSNQIAPNFDRNKKFFYALLIVVILVMLGGNTFFARILYRIPMLTTVRQLGRYSILFHTALSLLIAFGFDYIMNQRKVIAPYTKIIIAGTAFSTLSFITYLYLENTYFTPYREILLHLFFLMIITLTMLYVKNIKVLTVISFSSVVLAILSCNNYSYVTTNRSTYPLVYFKKNKLIDFLETGYGDYRVIFDTDKIPKNIGDVYNVQTKMGHGATINKYYFDFLCQQWDLNSEVNDLLNIKYVVTQDTLTLPLIMRDDSLGLKLYERPTAYARLFLVSNIKSNHKQKQHAFTFKKNQYSDLYQQYEITSSVSDTLIFSENYYYGWSAYLDSKKVPLLKPNINNNLPLLMGIAIPSGKHTVELRYNSLF